MTAPMESQLTAAGYNGYSMMKTHVAVSSGVSGSASKTGLYIGNEEKG